MAKEALRLRLRGCWVSKCLPFWAICLLYHSVWQWGWESQACRRGCAWGRALALFPLAGPSCLPLYPREPCLFICYYIRIGISKAGGPSAATTLAAFLCFSFSLSSSLSCASLVWTTSTCFISVSLLPSFSLLLSLLIPYHPVTVIASVDERKRGVWCLLADGDCCVLAAVLIAHPTGASVGLHWWGFPSFNEDYHVCVCMCVMIILLVISHFQEQ